VNDRAYEKKKQSILRFIKKHGRTDHPFILNEDIFSSINRMSTKKLLVICKQYSII
jgi:hypothetical protein